ncbi:hypothetical protein ACFL1H_00620, partial [Nanoarchaeota archaeon]
IMKKRFNFIFSSLLMIILIFTLLIGCASYSSLPKLDVDEIKQLKVPEYCTEEIDNKDCSIVVARDARNNEGIGWFFACSDLCFPESWTLVYPNIDSAKECYEIGGRPIKGHGWLDPSKYWYCAVVFE